MMLERLTSPRTPMAAAFRPVDVQAQSKAYRLAERGREDGLRNLPNEGTDELSLAEEDVIGAITDDRERWVDELASNLRAHRDALAQLQTSMEVAGLRQSADDAVARLGEIEADWRGEVAELRRKAISAKAEHDEFRQTHRIRRSARLPRSRFLNFSILFLCLAIESAINGLFFASGSDLGLVGGVFLALSLSCVNVIVGAASGWFLLRLTHSDRIPVFCFGAFSFLVVLIGLIIFNGVVAHYRDLFQVTGEATDIHVAWGSLITTPFGLTSISSYLLFLAGIGFCGTAIYEGHSMDDPFPAYGRHERRRVESKDDYEKARRDLIGEAADVRDTFSEETAQTREQLKGASARREQIIAARSRMVSEFSTFENNLEDAAHRLLSVYRRANEAARSSPPPPHFARRFSFPDRALDRREILALRQDPGLEFDAVTLMTELDELRRKVLDECAAVISRAPGDL